MMKFELYYNKLEIVMNNNRPIIASGRKTKYRKRAALKKKYDELVKDGSLDNYTIPLLVERFSKP